MPPTAPSPVFAPSASLGLSSSDVRAAAERIRDRVYRTPTLRSARLDEMAGCELWLKAENLQRIGAFKARGAMHAVGRLDPEARARGVITYSSGNHAQAVALAAKEFGISATIAMPTDAPRVKVDAVRRLGASIEFAGTTSDDRKRKAHEIADATGAPIIQPFDHPDIVAGAGTATLELVEDILERTGAPPDAVVVPVGGGGLVAGACLVCADYGISVYSVEPVGCDAMAQSLTAGERVAVPPGPTLGDGLKPVQVGELNFAIAKEHVVQSLHVDDEDMGKALVAALLHAKILLEPSGAAGLAVALRRAIPGRPGRIGILLSGGNVDPALVRELLARFGDER